MMVHLAALPAINNRRSARAPGSIGITPCD
jgi:hypothetical protein